jgi:hypothetical protein
MKKKKKKLIKVRRTWALNPVTRVSRDSKKYDRNAQKKSIRKKIVEEL